MNTETSLQHSVNAEVPTETPRFDFVVPTEKVTDPIVQRTAKILLIMLAEHLGKSIDLTRRQATFDMPMLSAASGESMITEGFIAALEDEFSKLGWYMFKLFGHRAQWAIRHADALDKTIKLGPKQVMSYQDLPIEELYKLYQALLAK